MDTKTALVVELRFQVLLPQMNQDNQNNIPNEAPNEAFGTTTTTEKPEEPKTFITWHLTMPRHVTEVTVSKIYEGKIVDEFKLETADFEGGKDDD